MFILRQSTAVDVLIGPFVDGTDGVTPEEALSPSVQLSKNGQTAATKNDVTTPVHDNAGYYNCEFDATDTGTVGQLVAFVEGSTATHLQVRHEFQIMDTAAFDALFADGAEGPLQATTVGRTLDILATGEVPVDFDTSIGTLDAAQFGADFLTSAKIADDAFLAVNFAANSLDGKGDWNIGKTGYSLTQTFPTNFADLAITVTTGLVSVGTLPSIPANWITAAGINAAALNGKGDWNIGKSGYALTVADWNVGKTGYSLSQAFPTNFADLAIVVTTGLVSVGTLPSIPANWITAAGINAAAITAAKFGAGALDAAALNADAAAKIRDAILPTQNAVFNNLEFLFVAASDHVTPVTGATGTGVTRSIDGGAFGAGTGTLAEVGNGIYQYDASAADMNGGIITFRFIGTGGTPGAPDDRFVTIVTGGGV